MDLNKLASDLRAKAAAHATIVLDDSVFSDETILAGIRSAFALPSGANLTISGVEASQIKDPVDGVLTISGGKASVFKREPRMTLTFTSPGNDLQAIIVAEMGQGWNFKDSFKSLDAFPFNKLELIDARFVYTTVAQPEYASTSEPTKIELAAGLNFLSQVTFQHVTQIQDLLKPIGIDWRLTLPFYGRFSPVAGEVLPVGKLRTVLTDKEFTIGVEPIRLTLGKPAIAVKIDPANKDDQLQPIDLLVEAEFQKVFDVAIAIPVEGGSFEVAATPKSTSGSIDELIAKLPGVDSLAPYIPQELNQVFATVAFDRFSLVVAPSMAVTYVGLAVSTGKPWKVGALELTHLRLMIETLGPADLNSKRVHIAANAAFERSMFEDDFLFTVDLEKRNAWEVKTITGAYNRSVSLGKIVGSSARGIPAFLKNIEFSDFGVVVNREAGDSNYNFYGSVECGFPILDADLSSAMTIAVTKAGANTQSHIGGSIVIGAQNFSFTLDLGSANSKLVAQWNKEGAPLGFRDIANALGWDSMPELPEGLDLALTEATITYDFKDTLVFTAKSANYGEIVFAALKKKDSTKRSYVFSVDIPLDIKFTDLPVVGDSLKLIAESLQQDAAMGVKELAIVVASEAFTDKEVQDLNALTEPVGAKPLMPKTLTEGVTLAAKLDLNGPHEIVLPLKRAPKQAEELPAATAAANYQADAKWLNLQKTLGPVHFDKVGVQYQGATLRFLLNAALSVAGLKLSVDGLSVGSSLKEFKPEPDIRGLGIEYKAGDLEIGGAFLKTGPDNYDGAAVIKNKQFAISALGSYAKLEGQPSLFIYAFLDYPLGGPSFFFITGLAAGFGYNRRLIAPSIEKVAEFPLITQAIRGRQDAPKNVMEALTQLKDYVPPNIGSIFLAVGVKFNSFKLVDSFALLTMEFGNDVVINLLGISTAIVPKPEKGANVTPLAQVQIAWKATFNPNDGCLGIDARLTPNSYILSKDCRLSGGYAFYSWFSGLHAGDFVQTLGGYHPEFTVPEYYPKVPRLAFDWRVSNSLTIQGNAYYALTGSALMAGGYLEVLFQQGELRAWLKVGANFLIAWKPYHYDAQLSVNVGASYTFDIDLLFGHIRTTISVDVGARLHLWGPDFSGTATIDLSVISFTIGFGAGASQAPQPIEKWTTFEESFLPKSDVCSISVKDGLIRKTQVSGKEYWIINPKDFSLTIDSAVPFKSAPPAVAGQKDLTDGANLKFGVGPMDIPAANFSSTFTVNVKKGSDLVNSDFNYSLVTKRVPAGLWGESVNPKLEKPGFVERVPSGVEIVPGAEVKPGDTATIDLACFEYSDAYYPKGGKVIDGDAFAWEREGSFTPLPDMEDPKDRREKIRVGIKDNARRASMLKELNVKADIKIGATVADDFVSAPQIGTL